MQNVSNPVPQLSCHMYWCLNDDRERVSLRKYVLFSMLLGQGCTDAPNKHKRPDIRGDCSN